MVVSDEAIESILTAMKQTMEQMVNIQKENSELHKQMYDFIKQGTVKTEGGSTSTTNQGNSSENSQNDLIKRPNTPKPIRPIIEEGVDDFGWQLFLDRWARYKLNAQLTEQKQICLELRTSCSPEIDRLLFEFIGAGDLNSPTLTEEKLLEYIKSVSVRSIHTDVHRWHFGQIYQQEGEQITKYVGRLKSQAVLCDFNIECGCGRNNSYAEEMISQRMTSGVLNPDHQAKLLGEAEDLNTLKLKVEKMISLETTDEATTKIRSPIGSKVAPMRSSQYKQRKRQSLLRDNSEQPRGRSKERRRDIKRRCRGCGRTSHPGGKSMSREDCPA